MIGLNDRRLHIRANLETDKANTVDDFAARRLIEIYVGEVSR